MTYFNHIVKSRIKRIMKAVTEKKIVPYKRIYLRLPTDFSAENLQTMKEWIINSESYERKKSLPEEFYLAELSFINGRKINFSPDKQKLRKLITTGTAL